MRRCYVFAFKLMHPMPGMDPMPGMGHEFCLPIAGHARPALANLAQITVSHSLCPP